jgi:predicted small lipoprotein YifL
MRHIARRIALTAMVVLLVAGGVMGCGKKGPPLAPLALIPPPPVHATYQLTANQVMLQWELDPEFQKKGKGGDMGVEIYRARRTLLEDACKGCPLPFEKLAEVSAATLEYRDSLERGFRYFYRLRTPERKRRGVFLPFQAKPQKLRASSSNSLCFLTPGRAKILPLWFPMFPSGQSPGAMLSIL